MLEMLRFKAPSGQDNLREYVAKAVLPRMPHGLSAPAMPPPGHKAHRNHIAVRPERYRERFKKIVYAKAPETFDNAVKNFAKYLPSKPQVRGEKDAETETGFALTVPAPGFDIPRLPFRFPSNLPEMAPWVMTLAFQTMTRAMHIAFPETVDWDVSFIDDLDASIWNTLVWRRIPGPPDPDRPWITVDQFKTCSTLFVVQPPWIMTPQDIKSFISSSSIPPFNQRRPENSRPFKSAHRVWAKLWDTCVRKKCHYWVITTYDEWVFGTFSEGYKAGQILRHLSHDACEPTILQCLLYHVAASMGFVKESKLPQYREDIRLLDRVPSVPEPSRIEDVEFTDSASEWDGMDDESGISAGVSASGFAILSAYGSERAYRRPRQSPSFIGAMQTWTYNVTDDLPEFERESSPVDSESAPPAGEIYAATNLSGNEEPVAREEYPWSYRGGFVLTTVPQGPVEEEDEGDH